MVADCLFRRAVRWCKQYRVFNLIGNFNDINIRKIGYSRSIAVSCVIHSDGISLAVFERSLDNPTLSAFACLGYFLPYTLFSSNSPPERFRSVQAYSFQSQNFALVSISNFARAIIALPVHLYRVTRISIGLIDISGIIILNPLFPPKRFHSRLFPALERTFTPHLAFPTLERMPHALKRLYVWYFFSSYCDLWGSAAVSKPYLSRSHFFSRHGSNYRRNHCQHGCQCSRKLSSSIWAHINPFKHETDSLWT